MFKFKGLRRWFARMRLRWYLRQDEHACYCRLP
jgi:hypothetical protein